MNKPFKATKVLIDEAVMLHYGAVVLIAMVTEAKDIRLYGDPEQVKFIERHWGTGIYYAYEFFPDSVTQMRVSKRVSASTAAGLSTVYNMPIYSSSEVDVLPRVIHVATIEEAISVVRPGPEVLVFYQDDKLDLKGLTEKFKRDLAYKESALQSVGESQGRTIKDVVVIRTSTVRRDLYFKPAHLIVAFSRHTHNFTYVVVNGLGVADGMIGMLEAACDVNRIEAAKYNEAVHGPRKKLYVRGKDYIKFDVITGTFLAEPAGFWDLSGESWSD